MGHSYKQMLIWVTDGDYRNTSGNARASRSRDKPMDRRIKRREHARIVRDATNSFYEDQEFNAMDLINYEDDWGDYDDYLNGDSGYYNDHPDLYDDYDLQLQHEDNHQHYYDDDHHDAYYDDYGMDWYRGYEETVIREEDPHDRIIKPEDTGKTLGEILQELEERKREQW